MFTMQTHTGIHKYHQTKFLVEIPQLHKKYAKNDSQLSLKLIFFLSSCPIF